MKTLFTFYQIDILEKAKKLFRVLKGIISKYYLPDDFFDTYQTLGFASATCCKSDCILKEETYVKKLVYINDSQSISIGMQFLESPSEQEEVIIINQAILIYSKNHDELMKLWKALQEFYNKFEEKSIPDISNQRFLQDFLVEVIRRCTCLDFVEKKDDEIAKIFNARFEGSNIGIYYTYSDRANERRVHYGDQFYYGVEGIKRMIRCYLDEGKKSTSWMSKYLSEDNED